MTKNLRRKFSFWTVITCLLAIGTLAFGQITKGEGAGADETNYFHVDIEEPWVKIPDEALSAFSEQILSHQDDQTAQCLAGYASTSGDNWFELPYILVVSQENGKIPQKLLDTYDKIASESANEFNESLQETVEQMSDGLASAQVGKTYYDERRRIIWLNMVMDRPQVGKVHVIFAMMPTEVGKLNFVLYVAPSDRETRLREFNDFLNRVTLDPSKVYRPDLKETLKIVGRGMNDAFDRQRHRGLFYGFILLCIVLLAGAYRVMSRIGWRQRIFIILSFGYLVFMIWLWHTEGKEYRERQMKESDLLIEREQIAADKARLIEIYELISGYDSERKDYAPGSINLSNLFEWLLIGNEESNKAIEERYPGSEILKPNVIENPDGRFTIVYDYAGKPKWVIEDGKLTIVYDSDSSQMGVVELLEYYVKQFSFPSDEHDWRRRVELAISQYKKDFDFSDIENRYKTRIHNNYADIHEQESKDLRRHIYVEMLVMYFIRWGVPVVLVYGLCLGIRKVIKQKRLENKGKSVIVTNETTKKIVAREGLSAIGAFLLANLICFVITLLVCKRSHLYLFSDALKAFLILYGSYLVVRFVIWSIKTLKTDSGGISKVFKIVIYSLLIFFALVYFGNYFDDTQKQHHHRSIY